VDWASNDADVLDSLRLSPATEERASFATPLSADNQSPRTIPAFQKFLLIGRRPTAWFVMKGILAGPQVAVLRIPCDQIAPRLDAARSFRTSLDLYFDKRAIPCRNSRRDDNSANSAMARGSNRSSSSHLGHATPFMS
jgi:hypothetical protein